ncbi:flippase-like domain-containing protein [Candidatus Dojkabacteria bacterium]|nr:flippase-like domain-containing protein [Candidatus Dojkabacteria bacterium]
MKNIKKTGKKYLKKGLQVSIYAIVIYFIVSRVSSTENIWENIHNIDTLYLGLSILVYAIQTILNAFIWFYIMKSSGEKVTLKSQIETYLDSYLMRYIPGNVVGILARGEFNRKNGVSRLKSLWGWFLENITFLAVGLSLGMYFVIKNVPQLLGLTSFLSTRSSLVIMSGVALIVLIILSTLLLMYKGNYMWEMFNKYILKGLFKKNLGKHVNIRLENKSRVIIVLAYIMSWGLYSLSFILLAYSIVPASFEFPLTLISINALAWSLGYLFIVTPSGTGVREAVFLALLPFLTVISPANSVLIAVGMRLVNVVGEVSAFVGHKIYTLLVKFNQKLD